MINTRIIYINSKTREVEIAGRLYKPVKNEIYHEYSDKHDKTFKPTHYVRGVFYRQKSKFGLKYIFIVCDDVVCELYDEMLTLVITQVVIQYMQKMGV